MSCVHYKFQSGLTYDFEGLHISSRELKRPVMKGHRLKTDEAGNDAVIPNNTSVIIRRIPAAGLKSTKRRFARRQAQPAGGSSQTQRVGGSSHLSLEQLLKTENLNEAQASEEDKLKAVMYQSSLCYYSSSDAMQLLGLLPPNYVCFHCGIPGHHIKNCPNNRDGGSAPSPFTVQTEPSSSSSSADPVSSGQAARGKRPRSRSPAEPRGEQKRSRH